LVGAELDVVAHHDQIHPNEFNREGIDNEFHLDVNCTADDINDAFFGKTVSQLGVEEACKVTVEPFVTADKFVAETEARHEVVFFEPEYGAESAREEDAFDSSRCNHLLGKAGAGGVAPFKGKIGFALDTWYCFNGMEQV
jgi:hypothetical protein